MEKWIPTDEKWKLYGGSSPLINVFLNYATVSKEVRDLVNLHTYPIHVKKNKFVISPAQHNDSIYLIVKGVIRGFVRDDDQEITTWISVEPDITGSISSFWGQDYPKDYLQCLEDCDLICIPLSLLQLLYVEHPEVNMIGRKIMEHYYQATEERAYIGRIMSAEKRYLRFVETRATLLNRISLKHIAAFLKMRIETLIRIRSKIAKTASMETEVF